MLRQINILILSILTGLFLVSCDDIFEEDISNESIFLVSPNDGAEIEGNFATLQWQSLEDAENYRLEIKSETTGFIKDTLSASSNVVIPLSADEYSWRVRGENSAYETSYSFERSFTMIDINDLTSQIVFLNTPSIDLFTQSDELILSWNEINAATGYELVVDLIVEGETMNVINETGLLSPTFLLNEVSIMTDGAYKWSVKAFNDQSETIFSNRFFFIDNELPAAPGLIDPENEEFLNTTESIVLDWMIPEDIGEIQSQISSVYELANDQNFQDIIDVETLTDESSNAEIQTLTTGTYFWRVRLIDEAGNQGEWSEIRSFTIA